LFEGFDGAETAALGHGPTVRQHIAGCPFGPTARLPAPTGKIDDPYAGLDPSHIQHLWRILLRTRPHT
jgi:hypothetical protein